MTGYSEQGRCQPVLAALIIERGFNDEVQLRLTGWEGGPRWRACRSGRQVKGALMLHCTQLAREERCLIGGQLEAGHLTSEIARLIERDNFGREPRRNRSRRGHRPLQEPAWES